MESNNKFEVTISKEFDVSVEHLYKAWTNPEDLKQWWKPMGDSLKDVKNELREGGAISYAFESSGLNISGEYAEVKENEKLVYSWDWNYPAEAVKNASYTLTIEFKSAENGSILQVRQEDFKDEEGVVVHQQGWEKALAGLQQYLSTSETATGDSPDAGQADGDRSGGYNESPEQVKVGGA